MRKSDLITAVIQAADLSPKHAEAAVHALLETITNALARAESVNLVGFGSFSVKTRATRSGRNPKNGEPITIAASCSPLFKAGKGLKDGIQTP